MITLKRLKLALGTACMLSTGAIYAGEVEVLHWWTSGGEAKAAAELKKGLEARQHSWRDFAVAGGGGENAMTVLKSRAVAGSPPTAAQLSGVKIQGWGKEGLLGDVSAAAKKQGWNRVVPADIDQMIQYQGKYVAIPVGVGRVNMLWVNSEVLRKSGAKVPNSWDEFFAEAEKIRKAGYVPLAHGGQSWQEGTLFETVALGVGGADYYRKAFVRLDPAVLRSPTTIQALATLKRLKQYVDKNAPGRDWNVATGMVIEGKAAFQLMGDWAKGEFTAAGKVPGKDYLCVAAPQTAGYFIHATDAFTVFKLTDADALKAQQDLAETIMSKDVQVAFSLHKGSIPVRTDVDLSKFDACSQASARDFAASAKSGKLMPSWAHNMAMYDSVRGAFFDVIGQYWNDDTMTPQQAAEKLVAAAKVKD